MAQLVSQINKQTGDPLTFTPQSSRVFAGRGPTGSRWDTPPHHLLNPNPLSLSPRRVGWRGGGMPRGEHSLPLGLKYPPGALGSSFTQHAGANTPPSLTHKKPPLPLPNE